MYAGSSRLALPIAWLTQPPTVGNPGVTKPLTCIVCPALCSLVGACIAIRNARSSTQCAMCGIALLTQRPHCPCCFHSHGLPSTGPGDATVPPLTGNFTFSPLRRWSAGL